MTAGRSSFGQTGEKIIYSRKSIMIRFMQIANNIAVFLHFSVNNANSVVAILP
jgi:hypothetical protein